MKHVSSLTDTERTALIQVYKQESVHRVRQRAHAILHRGAAFGQNIPLSDV